jgi:hypothetical protein
METEQKPYLVQRIEKLRSPNYKIGVDCYFSFDYMGSSEFEFGALFKALKAMRAQDYKKWAPFMVVTSNGHYLWYVGPEALKKVAADFFEAQMAGTGSPLKEATYMTEVLNDRPLSWLDPNRYVGWWCIDQGLEFCLFRDKDDAGKWLDGLNDNPH